MRSVLARGFALAVALAATPACRAADPSETEETRRALEFQRREIASQARAVRVFDALITDGKDWVAYDTLPLATEVELSRLDDLCKAPSIPLKGNLPESPMEDCSRVRITGEGGEFAGNLRKADLFGDGRTSLIYSGGSPFGDGDSSVVWIDVARPEAGRVSLGGQVLRVRMAHDGKEPFVMAYGVSPGGTDIGIHDIVGLRSGSTVLVESLGDTDLPPQAVHAESIHVVPAETELWRLPGVEPYRPGPEGYEAPQPEALKAGTKVAQIATLNDAEGRPWSFVVAKTWHYGVPNLQV